MLKTRDICFVVIYLIEQLALILLVSFRKEDITLWVSMFPVIFLSTIAIEKLLLTAKHEEDLLKKGDIDKEREISFKTLSGKLSKFREIK